MKRGTRRRWLRRMLIGGPIALLLALAVLWLALRHIPSWYRPVSVPPDELQRVRDTLADTFRSISDRMVQGRPFEVTATDQMITEWLIARAHIWPDSESWLPPWLRDPVVVFRPGRVILAAHMDREEWESILSAHFSLEVVGDDVMVSLERIAAGSVPIPVTSVAGLLDTMVQSDRLDTDAMPEDLARAVRKLRENGALSALSDGYRADGPFLWRNGNRPFYVRDVTIGEGWIRVRFDPVRKRVR